jgi:O-antigen ligase
MGRGLLSIPNIKSGWQWMREQSPTTLLIPLAIGLAVCAVTYLDPQISENMQLELGSVRRINIFQSVPYLLSLLVLILPFFVIWSMMNFWGVNEALMVVAFFILHMSIVNVGPADLFLSFILLGFVLWIIKVLVYNRRFVPPCPTVIVSFLLLAFAVVSCSQQGFIQSSVKGLFYIFLDMVFVFLVINLATSEEKVRKFINLAIAAAVFSSVLGIGQWLLWRLTGTVVVGSDAAGQMWEMSPWGPIFAANALVRGANHFGAFIAWPCAMAFYLGLSPAVEYRQQWLYRIAFCILFIGVILSFAKIGWIALIICFIVAPYLLKPNVSTWYTCFLVFALLLALLGGIHNVVYDMITAFNTGSLGERYTNYGLAIQAFKEHPLTGVGLFTFEEYPENLTRYPVHNAILQVFTEVGLFAGLTYCFILGSLYVRLILLMRRPLSPLQRAFVHALFLAHIELFIHSQMELMAYFSSVWLLIGLSECALRVYGMKVEARLAWPLFRRDAWTPGGSAVAPT